MQGIAAKSSDARVSAYWPVIHSATAAAKSIPSPASIPDYLALVGDAADGYPGLPGWGAKSSAGVLGKFLHLENIPTDCREWRVNAANASALADTLSSPWWKELIFCKADSSAGCATFRRTWQPARKCSCCDIVADHFGTRAPKERSQRACQSGFSALAVCPHPVAGEGSGSG